MNFNNFYLSKPYFNDVHDVHDDHDDRDVHDHDDVNHDVPIMEYR